MAATESRATGRRAAVARRKLLVAIRKLWRSLSSSEEKVKLVEFELRQLRMMIFATAPRGGSESPTVCTDLIVI
jgi:hypothetical protein